MPETRPYRWFRLALPALLMLGLSGCAFLPSAGPLRKDIQDEYSAAGEHPFLLIDVTGATIDVLKQRADTRLARLFGANAPDLLIGPGDGLTVTVWEAGTQPLFAPMVTAITPAASTRGTTLPEQTVDADGTISVPFAGGIKVAGHNIVQAQSAIQSALAGKTVQPQVLVLLSHNVSNTVTVVGEVTAGGRVALSTHGDRLLDVLAAAGGIRAATYETQITLNRGGSGATVPLLQVLQDPQENVFMQPSDVLIVTRQPETFTAFGATGRNAQINFDATQVSLIEAVAKAGGLLDQRADPRGIFLFRHEPDSLAGRLAGAAPPGGNSVPVVYRLDLTKANGYFLAGEFPMRDGDILFVSSAPANELQKFLELVGLLSQPAIQGAVVRSAVK